MADLEIFLVTHPGLESFLADEAREASFDVVDAIPGGVTLNGGWPEVWRANMTLRGATRVLARVAQFRAMHLAQLDKRARKLPWADWLDPALPVRVESTCRKSRIYHAKAATQRIERALTEAHGLTLSQDAEIVVKLRIDDDLATISLDTSGPSLHKRGLKQAVAKAPMRETLASLLLRAAHHVPGEPVLDPMCGSGTFPIEAAEIFTSLAPGRARSFAFQDLATFDADKWDTLRAEHTLPDPKGPPRYFGSDRDQGAVRMAAENADRAGVAALTSFTCLNAADIAPPDGPPGLVIVNPPYGGRIGNKKPLFGLYASLGAALKQRFTGWRVALVTSDTGLARATGLPFGDIGPHIDHGGIKIRLHQTGVL